MYHMVFRQVRILTKYAINRFVIRPLMKVDPWHDYPYEHKKYAMETVDFINKDEETIKWNRITKKDCFIVEVGCGRGDIIGRIKRPCRGKTGYDLETQILKVGGYFHHDVSFQEGSFPDVKEKNISILIGSFVPSVDKSSI